jgi:hypothetical protein
VGTRATTSSRRTRQETESQRLRRLERQRLQNARRRRADTDDDSLLVQESEEQRQRRLQKQREYDRRCRTEQHVIDRQRVQNARRRRADEAAKRQSVRTGDADDRESDQHRLARLERQHAYGREKRREQHEDTGHQHIADEIVDTPWVRLRDAVGTTETAQLAPLSLDHGRAIEERLRVALGADGLNECLRCL